MHLIQRSLRGFGFACSILSSFKKIDLLKTLSAFCKAKLKPRSTAKKVEMCHGIPKF